MDLQSHRHHPHQLAEMIKPDKRKRISASSATSCSCRVKYSVRLNRGRGFRSTFDAIENSRIGLEKKTGLPAMKPEEVVDASFSTVDDPNPELLGLAYSCIVCIFVSSLAFGLCNPVITAWNDFFVQQLCALESWGIGLKNQELQLCYDLFCSE